MKQDSHKQKKPPVQRRRNQGQHRSAPGKPTYRKSPSPSRNAVVHRAGKKSATTEGTRRSTPLLTRRQILYGAVGLGVAAAAVGGGAAVMNALNNTDESDLLVLDVPESSVTALSDMTLVEDAPSRLSLTGSTDVPFGTLVWANSDTVAACLVPTETGSPLTQIALLNLQNATVTTVLEQAVGTDEGFEIYDVRASEGGMIWTEANILDGTWRIYAASSGLSTNPANGAEETLDTSRTGEYTAGIGKPVLVDFGDSTTEVPSLAVVGDYAFWQLLPHVGTNTSLSEQPESVLRRAQFTTLDSEKEVVDVFSSARKMATNIYALEDAVVITPRAQDARTFYCLTKIDAASGKTTATLTLPQGMRPLEAGFGKTGFMFSFENIYNYGKGIANLGTYTPLTLPSSESDYSHVPWFSFARTPTAPPAWCGTYLIVKSSYSITGIDFDANEYFSLDVENGADTFGEYLATTGTHNRIVTFTNIDYQPVNDAAVNVTRIKIYQPTNA